MRALELACAIIQLGNISGGTWKPFGNTLDLGMEPGSHISFGASISVSSNGSIMAVSSSTTDDSYTQGVYIYEEYTDPDTNEFAWRQMGTTISSHDGSEENLSSISLSNDGLTIAIGSCSYSSNAGRVLIYSYSADSDNWVLDYLYSGSVSGEQLGFSVAISGDGLIVVAGAPTYNTDDGVVKSFAFNKVLQQWEHMNDLLYESVETGVLFGTSVGLSYTEDYLLAVSGKGNSGNVWFFGLIEDFWYEIENYQISGSISNSQFGSSLALSANRQIVAVGAIASSSNAGCVHVYNCSATACEAVGSVLSGDWEDDMFGNALSLSGDGLWLAVSANASSGSYVRVYYYNTDSMDWELNKSYRGNDINKNYGSCVVLSEDGSTLAIGSITDPGYVYVTHYNALSRNVALNKSALQSSQTEITTPELAINGNTRGILSDGNCLATAEEMNPWMMIDLEGSFIINQIVIYERLDCSGCDASLYDLSVEILSQAEQVLETLTYPGIVIDQVSLVTNGNPIGSYIKITRGGTTSAEMTICEVEVFGLEADSATPSITPSTQPSLTKSSIPTLSLSLYPSNSPSSQSSLTPSYLPSFNQTAPPSLSPSFPSSISPTTKPTSKVSINPSFQPSLTLPSLPSKRPSTTPSTHPSQSPSLLPSVEPSASLSTSPSYLPSMSSSWYPSRLSSKKPSTAPSTHPSQSPSLLPSVEPSASLSTSHSYFSVTISNFPSFVESSSFTPSVVTSSILSHQEISTSTYSSSIYLVIYGMTYVDAISFPPDILSNTFMNFFNNQSSSMDIQIWVANVSVTFELTIQREMNFDDKVQANVLISGTCEGTINFHQALIDVMNSNISQLESDVRLATNKTISLSLISETQSPSTSQLVHSQDPTHYETIIEKPILAGVTAAAAAGAAASVAGASASAATERGGGGETLSGASQQNKSNTTLPDQNSCNDCENDFLKQQESTNGDNRDVEKLVRSKMNDLQSKQVFMKYDTEYQIRNDNLLHKKRLKLKQKAHLFVIISHIIIATMKLFQKKSLRKQTKVDIFINKAKTFIKNMSENKKKSRYEQLRKEQERKMRFQSYLRKSAVG